MQIEKVYEPQRIEPHWAQWWIDSGIFRASNRAQRCARAAKDTAGLIEESIDTSRDGNARLDQMAGAELDGHAASLRALVTEMREIVGIG